MRILALVTGRYGERIVENLRRRAPRGWTVESVAAPLNLPAIVEFPDRHLPQPVPPADLLLGLQESSRAAQLIPRLAELAGVKAVIVPIDNTHWLPLGLRNQLQRELADLGLAAVFPRTFCTLTEDSYGYGRAAEDYDHELITLFGCHFGRPKLKIAVDPQSRRITSVEVVRGAPCGSTHYTAERMIGLSVDEAVPKAGLICHHYPCLASMDKEAIDDRLTDTLMHVSGYVVNEEVAERLRPYKQPPDYLVPEGQSEPPAAGPGPGG
ncbi:MAG: hypothetical protein HY687_01255 [Chloroflexi bacterium]|nr:hypothetical protein [Chloroflexota bacterium]